MSFSIANLSDDELRDELTRREHVRAEQARIDALYPDVPNWMTVFSVRIKDTDIAIFDDTMGYALSVERSRILDSSDAGLAQIVKMFSDIHDANR